MMNKIISFISISIIFCFLFSACKKDKKTEVNMGYNYFPNTIGRYVIYNVDSSSYVALDSFIHYKLQVKEKITDIYNDNQNRPTLRLERYVKYFNDTIPYSSMTWDLKDVWAENLTTTTAEKVEENIRYVKLAFPVKEGQSWNGNAQNTNTPQDYSYNYFDESMNVNSINFDSVLSVNQLNEESLINKYYSEEKYARNVGLIYKKEIAIQSQCTGCSDSVNQWFLSQPILNRITYGTIYTMSVVSYGVE